MIKKLLFLIFFLFLITGCYDYKEIRDLAFITSLGIDFEDSKYEITIEVLTSKSSEGGQTKSETYTESATGKTLPEAFDNLSLEMMSYPYYYHLKALIVSENVAKNKMKEIIDYTTRGSEIRNEFFLILAKDVSAKKMVNTTSENAPIVGETIMNMIENSTKVYSSSYNKMYEDNLKTFLNEGIDTITSAFTVEDDIIKSCGTALFDDYKYIDTLSLYESSLLNSLITSKTNYLLKKKYDDQEFIVNVYSAKPKFSFANNKAKIKIDLDAEIKLNTPSIDLKKSGIYEKLNKDFSTLAQKEYEDLLKKLKNLDVDPLGLGLKYYQKTKKKQYDIYQKDTTIDTSIQINKNGLIYEVKDV